jgi:hypothetical protein
MIKNLAASLTTVDHRVRISPEYAYYEGYALSQARVTAARALSSKRNERDLLLYRGDPQWKYKRSLKTIDDDIVRLEENLRKANEVIPLVAGEPVFKLASGNITGSFPEPPKAGGEYRFCRGQTFDAFLSGRVTEFHGRIYITMRLYALYTNSYIYEDEIIFSPDALDGVVEEFAGRLVRVLSGTLPSAFIVRADPPETLVLINKTFAGRGEIELQERSPATILIDLSAENYIPQSVEIVLHPGELTEVDVTLQKEVLTETEINVPKEGDVLLYQGAQYVGQAPLTLKLPAYQLEYINARSSSGRVAAAVFVTPDILDGSASVSLRLKIPLPVGQKRVEKARRQHYWAWGATWIAGITAWMVNGFYTSQLDGYQLGLLSGPDQMYKDTNTLRWVSIGAIGLIIAAAGNELLQTGLYLYKAGADATPIIK